VNGASGDNLKNESRHAKVKEKAGISLSFLDVWCVNCCFIKYYFFENILK